LDRVHLTVSGKEWLENRLEELAELFAVAIGGFSVIDSHLHAGKTQNRLNPRR
jgi:hypothetical protein